MRAGRVVSGGVVMLLACAAPVWAQDARVTGADELNAAVVERAGEREQQRARLLDVLDRAEVREVAEERGFDMERVRAAAMALSDQDLGAVAPLVESLAGELVGGQTLTITATTLIIILLLVILIIVAT